MSIARPALTRIAPQLTLWALIALACALAVSTYSVFGHTWDEPEHIAAGMAMVDKGEYPYDVQHPPLARIAMAIGPHLAGAHSYGNPGPSGEQEGRDILYRPASDGQSHYDQYLTLARVGMLPFLVLLLIATWTWSRHIFGIPTAVLATALVVTSPVIIGHAAVAALDVPMAATTMLAMYWLIRWFEKPSVLRAFAFGIAAGLATGTKISAPPFLICVTLVWIAAWAIYPHADKSDSIARPTITKAIAHAGIAAVIALSAFVFCYGFSFTPWSPDIPVPVPVGVLKLIDAIAAIRGHNDGGHLSYFMGELRRTGWWNFYLVALGVKTPLPMLLLGISGLGWLSWRGWRDRNWLLAAPSFAFVAILLSATIISHINIGVRHVMVLFPLLAIVAAAFVTDMWRQCSRTAIRSHMAIRALLVALLGWQIWSMAHAHPDYLAYFNELAGNHPEKILVDSDLDWGQDMRRLENELHARNITEFALVYRGTADLPHENLPHYQRLWPNDRATGWIAVSLLAKATDESGGYLWLDAYQPVMRVGKSIDLYYIVPK